MSQGHAPKRDDVIVELRWRGTGAPTTEYNVPFLQGMLDRMNASFFKYGSHDANADAGGMFVEGLKLRLARYEEDGNIEWLMDVANMAMIEYMHPGHPEAHYKATDSSESPGIVFAGKVNVMGGQGKPRVVHTHVSERD